MQRSLGSFFAFSLVFAAAPSRADDADFAARCEAADVVVCVGFDDPADLEGPWDGPSGVLSGDTTPELDSTLRASGTSSLRFTIPANAGSDTSGSYWTNFSRDYSIQFGENETFFVQWRQRFSSEFLAHRAGGGWKQAIIGTGDRAGTNYNSCTALEVVTQNTYNRGLPTMYNSCTGSASHGAYDGFEEPFGAYDFLLQNARADPHCLYTQGQTDPPTYFPPEGNCFGYTADEWMTFQVQIELGPRSGDEFADSHVRLWIARDGEASEAVMDYGPYNLTAGAPEEDQRFGAVWLTPYNTGRDEGTSYPEGYTWYDELIVSRTRIADPGLGLPDIDGGPTRRDGGAAPRDGGGSSDASSSRADAGFEGATGCGCRATRSAPIAPLAIFAGILGLIAGRRR
jgi:hypothetical protein